MPRNLNTALPRKRRRGNAMTNYDALPAELRGWLSQAALPWSPISAQRIWFRAGGARNAAVALERLDAIERATLLKDRLIG